MVVMAPKNGEECNICKKAGRTGKIKVENTPSGWVATCNNPLCDYFDSWHSPNYGRKSWQSRIFGAHR